MSAPSDSSAARARMVILLITATITPPDGATKLMRADPVARLADYRDALRFYLGRLAAGEFDGIVFTDNSDSDASSLQALAQASGHGSQVEFIRYAGLDYPPARGRGYGEMRLVDYTMGHSALIAAAPPDALIWKVTGRYVVRNLTALVRRGDGASLHCQCRNHPMRWVDMYVLAWTKQAYARTLAGSAERIREDIGAGGSAEPRFRDLIDELALHMPVNRRFRQPPHVEGVRGYDNQRYETHRAKALARRVLARAAPWLWI